MGKGVNKVSADQIAYIRNGYIPKDEADARHVLLMKHHRARTHTLTRKEIELERRLSAKVAHFASIVSMDNHPTWGPIFSKISQGAGPDIALACFYQFMGYTPLDSYRLVYSRNVSKVPKEWLEQILPIMGAVVASLGISRMWLLATAKSFIEDGKVSNELRIGLLQWLGSHMTPAQEIGPRMPNKEQGQAINSLIMEGELLPAPRE